MSITSGDSGIKAGVKPQAGNILETYAFKKPERQNEGQNRETEPRCKHRDSANN